MIKLASVYQLGAAVTAAGEIMAEGVESDGAFTIGDAQKDETVRRQKNRDATSATEPHWPNPVMPGVPKDFVHCGSSVRYVYAKVSGH